MRELVHAKSSTLKQLFTRSHYEVPSFQRMFSWRKENVDDFWNDISEAMRDRKCHFFGAIVLQTNKKGVNIIYDGQQRLTVSISLLTLIRCIASETGEQREDISQKSKFVDLSKRVEKYLFNKSKEPYLKLSEYNRRFFNESVLGHYREAERQGYKSNDNLYKFAFLNLEQKVAEEVSKQTTPELQLDYLNDLFEFMLNKLYFAVIHADKHFSSGVLFETLNFRGAQLSTSDLFKSILFAKADEQRCKNSVEQLWKDLVEIINGENINLSEFLKHFWTAKHGRLVEGSLYKILKRDLENSPNVKVSDYLKEIKSSLLTYTKILNPSFPNNRFLEESINAINKIGAKESYPLLLSIISLSLEIEINNGKRLSGDEQAEIRKQIKILLRQIENLDFRFLICKKTDSREVSKIYATASKEIQQSPMDSLKKLALDLKRNAPDDRIFEQEFANYVSPSTKISLYILHKIETSIRGNREPLSRNPREITLEHIMPKKLDSSWKKAEKYHKNYLNRIGNLTLLSAKLNRTNASFGRKRNKYYANSEVDITKTLIGYSKWGKNQIIDRQRDLGQKAVNVWDV